MIGFKSRTRTGTLKRRTQLEYIAQNNSFKKKMAIVGLVSGFLVFRLSPAVIICTMLLLFDIGCVIAVKAEEYFTSKIYYGRINGYAANSKKRYSFLERFFSWLWVGVRSSSRGRLILLMLVYPLTSIFQVKSTYDLTLLSRLSIPATIIGISSVLILEIYFFYLLFYKYKDDKVFEETVLYEKPREAPRTFNKFPNINIMEREAILTKKLAVEKEEKLKRQQMANARTKVRDEQEQIKKAQGPAAHVAKKNVSTQLAKAKDAKKPNGTFTRGGRSL